MYTVCLTYITLVKMCFLIDAHCTCCTILYLSIFLSLTPYMHTYTPVHAWDLMRRPYFGFTGFFADFTSTYGPEHHVVPVWINGSAIESLFGRFKFNAGGNLSDIMRQPYHIQWPQIPLPALAPIAIETVNWTSRVTKLITKNFISVYVHNYCTLTEFTFLFICVLQLFIVMFYFFLAANGFSSSLLCVQPLPRPFHLLFAQVDSFFKL